MTLEITHSALFEPFTLSAGLELPNRIILAPCTRNRATADMAPTPGAIEHYASRADAGLLITEATLISPGIQGYLDTPGIYLASHVEAWRKVCEEVHRRGGRIFLQLWHPGRMTHSHFAGRQPRAPSPVLDPNRRRQVGDLVLYHEEPVAMTEEEVEEALGDYETATERAMEAGFDGVEIHGANGYLPEQFWRQHTNRRTDMWGGTIERRARFTIDLCRRLTRLTGEGKVGLRISPAAYFSEMRYTEGDSAAMDLILDRIQAFGMAYVHTGIVDDEPIDYLGGTSTEYLRKRWPGVLIGNGGYTPEVASGLVAGGACELVAFGKLFLANSDLVSRLRDDLPLAEYSRAVLETLV